MFKERFLIFMAAPDQLPTQTPEQAKEEAEKKNLRAILDKKLLDIGLMKDEIAHRAEESSDKNSEFNIKAKKVSDYITSTNKQNFSSKQLKEIFEALLFTSLEINHSDVVLKQEYDLYKQNLSAELLDTLRTPETPQPAATAAAPESNPAMDKAISIAKTIIKQINQAKNATFTSNQLLLALLNESLGTSKTDDTSPDAIILEALFELQEQKKLQNIQSEKQDQSEEDKKAADTINIIVDLLKEKGIKINADQLIPALLSSNLTDQQSKDYDLGQEITTSLIELYDDEKLKNIPINISTADEAAAEEDQPPTPELAEPVQQEVPEPPEETAEETPEPPAPKEKPQNNFDKLKKLLAEQNLEVTAEELKTLLNYNSAGYESQKNTSAKAKKIMATLKKLAQDGKLAGIKLNFTGGSDDTPHHFHKNSKWHEVKAAVLSRVLEFHKAEAIIPAIENSKLISDYIDAVKTNTVNTFFENQSNYNAFHNGSGIFDAALCFQRAENTKKRLLGTRLNANEDKVEIFLGNEKISGISIDNESAVAVEDTDTDTDAIVDVDATKEESPAEAPTTDVPEAESETGAVEPARPLAPTNRTNEAPVPIQKDPHPETKLIAQIDQGMTYEEAVKFIENHRDSLGFLLGDDDHMPLKNFIDNAKTRNPISSVTYRWDALQQESKFGSGDSACGWTVSTLIGLGEPDESIEGKEGRVYNLAERLIAGNMEKTGRPGLILGSENYQKGDVLVFKGYKNEKEERAYKKYAHIAIVRFRMDLPVYDQNGEFIGNEEYLGIIDEGTHLQGTIVPVNRSSGTTKHLKALLNDPQKREAYFEKHPELTDLKDLYSERKYVNVTKQAWFSDALQGGDIAFGIRTTALAEEGAARIARSEIPEGKPAIQPQQPPKPAAAPAVEATSHSAQPETLTTNLQKDIEKITENMKGTVAVSIFDPETGKYLAHLNENKITPPASLIKVPILFALHKAVEAGRVDEKDFQNLKDHAEKMIVDSNNHSTDVIIKQIGMKWINQCFQKLNLKDTKLNRFLFYKDSQELGENWTTPEDMTKIMALAITQEPPAGWPSAMDLMELNASKAGPGSLAKTLPQNVKIAQKGGQLNKSLGALKNVEHYAATFTLGKKTLIMVVMVSDFDTRNHAKEGIRKIGMLAYNELKRKQNDIVEIAQKTPEKSNNEIIETTYNEKSFPTYIDYPKNPSNKPVEYLTYIHGDGSNLDNSKAKVLSYVNRLRAQGRNVVLIMPEADRKGTRAKSWNWINQQPSPFDKIIAHAKAKAGEGKFNVVSFSGGYRALNHIKANSNQQISEIIMLDSSYPKSKDTLKYYADKNTKITLITGASDQSVQTNETANSLQGTKNIKIIQTGKHHGDVNLNFLKGELPA